ncbi:MAG: helix-hairpin-helix domain-containing protein [Acidobacteria bacterium]|nr:helix-hairpin-helix domain-containing protein [Acidobacteriota bacterium]
MRLSARFSLAIAVLAVASSAPVLPSQPQPHANQPASTKEPVDINTASLDQLMRVPGLPRTWAARIVRYRPYRGKNELLDRGIVSSEVYARIKDHIVAHRIRK